MTFLSFLAIMGHGTGWNVATSSSSTVATLYKLVSVCVCLLVRCSSVCSTEQLPGDNIHCVVAPASINTLYCPVPVTCSLSLNQCVVYQSQCYNSLYGIGLNLHQAKDGMTMNILGVSALAGGSAGAAAAISVIYQAGINNRTRWAGGGARKL